MENAKKTEQSSLESGSYNISLRRDVNVTSQMDRPEIVIPSWWLNQLLRKILYIVKLDHFPR